MSEFLRGSRDALHDAAVKRLEQDPSAENLNRLISIQNLMIQDKLRLRGMAEGFGAKE